MTIGRRIVVAVLSGSCLASIIAPTAKADLPPAVRTADPADSFKAAVDKFVDAQITDVITKVKAGDLKSSQSRDELCRQVESNANVVPSSSFQTIYLTAAIAHLQPLESDPDVVVRLNSAIIVSRLCASTQSQQLSAPVLTLLQDKSPAVALWGIKAAGTLLPPILALPANAKNQQLTKNLVEAVRRLHTVGAVVQDAYDALNLPDQIPGAPATSPVTLGICADAICDVLDIRVKDYQAGTVVDPQTDQTGLLFLTRVPVYQAMTPSQRLKSVQAMSDLLIAAARRAATNPGPQRDDFYKVVSGAAGGLYVVMRLDQNVTAAARYAALLKVPGTFPPNEIVKMCVDALSVVRDTPAYKTVKELAPGS